MKNPSTVNLVREITEFVDGVNKGGIHKDIPASVNIFFREFMRSTKEHALWHNASSEEIENTRDGIEQYIMTRIHSKLLDLKSTNYIRVFSPTTEDSSLDRVLSARLATFHHLKPENLGISPKLLNDTASTGAIDELKKINTYKIPKDKMTCVQNCCKIIVDMLARKRSKEKLEPILNYVVLHANPPQLHSNLKFILEYRNPEKTANDKYILNLQSTVLYWVTVDKSELLKHDTKPQERKKLINPFKKSTKDVVNPRPIQPVEPSKQQLEELEQKIRKQIEQEHLETLRKQVQLENKQKIEEETEKARKEQERQRLEHEQKQKRLELQRHRELQTIKLSIQIQFAKEQQEKLEQIQKQAERENKIKLQAERDRIQKEQEKAKQEQEELNQKRRKEELAKMQTMETELRKRIEQEQLELKRIEELEREKRLQEQEQERKRLQGERIALLIGNEDYATAGKLSNPVRDVKAISKSLEKVGFKVTTVFNTPTLVEMNRAVDKFCDKVVNLGDNLKCCLFYYAGHGIQMNEKNHAIPTELKVSCNVDIRDKCLNLNTVLDKLSEISSSKSVQVMMLDACRNEYDSRSWVSNTRSTLTQGLSNMQAPNGSFVLFSTAPGKVALDTSNESGEISPFAFAIEKSVQSGAELYHFGRSVIKEVQRLTKEVQNPYISSTLGDDFVL